MSAERRWAYAELEGMLRGGALGPQPDLRRELRLVALSAGVGKKT